MKNIASRLCQAVDTGPVEVRPASDGQCYVPLSDGKLPAAIKEIRLLPETALIDLWAVQDVSGPGFILFYAFTIKDVAGLLILEVKLHEKHVASIARDYPLASYLERVVRDGFGIEFDGAFDRRRLFLHEIYPEDFHPLLKTFRNGQPGVRENISPADEYKFKPVNGEGVYQIPVGPVHAGIIEPGHFRFSVIGETILNLEIRHFYKHRGLEKLAEGLTPAETVKIAEAVSGDETAANACCFAMAVEYAAQTEVPRRAWQLRTILLEMERIYSHLGDLAGMSVDCAYPVGAMPFFNLREEFLRWNATLTGSRFLKGVFIPGGLSRDIAPEDLKKLDAYLPEFNLKLERALGGIYNVPWVIDRFETTGVIKKTLIQPLNLTGPTARASGGPDDVRHDLSYGVYGELGVDIKTREAGDVLARFQVKAEEIKESTRLLASVLPEMSRSEIAVPCQPSQGRGLAMVEAARGQNLCWINIRDGHVDRFHVRTASFCNWLAIEHAVLGNIVPDFPLINKSLNLSYAGNDL